MEINDKSNLFFQFTMHASENCNSETNGPLKAFASHLPCPVARINFQTEIVNGELSCAKRYPVTQ